MTRLWKALTLLVSAVALGTLGYLAIEQMTLLDALYMTVTTISTVGFGEIHPLSPAGRAFTIALIIFGVSTMAWAAESMVAFLLEDQFRHTLWRRRMERNIARLNAHYIVCGYGRMGQQIGLELTRRGLDFVVIDRDPQILAMLQTQGVPYVEGDATSDSTLREAGVTRARGVATALSGDADNALIVISVKGLNPRLQVVARASNQETEEKLLRAGADRVVTPYTIGGQRMAMGLLQPAVNEFLNSVVFDAEKHTELGEVEIRADSALAGRSLRDSHLRERWGAIVVAIKDHSGALVFSPPAQTVLCPGDTLILVASTTCLRELQLT
ncbi:MAG: TrkA family potassium uptake protein [Candidatus Tectimicrobiota bacterium]